MANHPNRGLHHRILAEIRALTGRVYDLDLTPLSAESLRELLRMIRYAADERDAAVRRVQRMPWRRP